MSSEHGPSARPQAMAHQAGCERRSQPVRTMTQESDFVNRTEDPKSTPCVPQILTGQEFVVYFLHQKVLK
jgi:hypothetical protein